METREMIPAAVFCSSHNIELSFISTLQTYGLIEVLLVEEDRFIPAAGLTRLEQLMRMHFDLNINLEGIDAIMNLLDRVQNMQTEIRGLQTRLGLYEDNG